MNGMNGVGDKCKSLLCLFVTDPFSIGDCRSWTVTVTATRKWPGKLGMAGCCPISDV